MVEFICDNQEIEDLLVKIHGLVTANGGYVHEDVRICARDGSMTIEAAASAPKREVLITITDDVMLPMELFQLSLEGDEFVLKSVDDAATPIQVALMEAMLGLYNLTGKMASHRKTSTSRLYFDDPELFARICNPGDVEKFATIPQERFDMEMFLSTRYLPWRTGLSGGDVSKVLLPLIDLFNNHVQAQGFGRQGKSLSVVRSSPVTGSDECFVQYGKYDAHDLLLGYDYVDEYALFVTSQPMTIKPGEKASLEVGRNVSGPSNVNLSKRLMPLRRFLPTVKTDSAGGIPKVDFLLIPPAGAPRALRRVLINLISSIVPHLDQKLQMGLVSEAEHQVVAANVDYYEKLAGYLDDHETKAGTELIVDNIKRMAAAQLARVKAYSFENARAPAEDTPPRGGLN